MNITDKFIDILFNLSRLSYPKEVIHQTKRCLLDYMGVALAGSKMLEVKGNRLLELLDTSESRISVIGYSKKSNLYNAILVNGLSSHVAELDDGSRYGAIHLGAPILSALLPIAEKENIDGSRLLSGIITGYEAAIRLSSSIQPSHYNAGFHPTATCGTVGVAIGIAAMLDFSKSQMKDALSAASISASGSLIVIEEGSELKPYNVGKASINGYISAMVALSGFTGTVDSLSGSTGFLSMMGENTNLSSLLNDSESLFGVEKVYFKPFASCRHTHSAIEAALKIKNNSVFAISDIKSIKIITYKGVLGKHDHKDINGSASAKMSIPYSVAIALITGKAGLDEFEENFIYDLEVMNLIKKIEVEADDEISSLVPHKRAAIVEIQTSTGGFFKERIDYPKGEPENMMTDTDLESKFISLSNYSGKSNETTNQIIKTIWNIESEIRNLYGLI